MSFYEDGEFLRISYHSPALLAFSLSTIRRERFAKDAGC